jgi:HlyD family secretion protein
MTTPAESRLFRKTALDRLSSPEELDQVVKISVGGSWIVLVAVLLFCAGATVWAITSRLPTTAAGRGMIVRIGGVLNVVSRGGGVVRSVDVRVGQRVEANQVVARIAQPALAERLRGLTDELSQVTAKRRRDLQLKRDEGRLRLEAFTRQRANAERAIGEIAEQARLAREQIPVMQQLFTRGLVTNQQVIAAQERLVELNGSAEVRRAEIKQLDAQAFEVETQIAALEGEIALDVAGRQRDVTAAQNELTLHETVTTPYAGAVLEIKVTPGGTVTDNTPILSLQADTENLEVLTYVASAQAKDIRDGMEVRIAPSTVKREEYGYMRGRVTFVADYPATAAAVMRNFQNDQLVTTLTREGPMTEVRVALEPDAQTASGFRWSSPGGPPIRISAGTMADTEIVTATRAPITLVVPILRQKLGL